MSDLCAGNAVLFVEKGKAPKQIIIVVNMVETSKKRHLF